MSAKPCKPSYATVAEWKRLGYKPVPGAPVVACRFTEVIAAWNVEPIGTGRRAPA